MNICEHLTNSAKIFPDRTAIRFEGKSISYARLDELSQHAAAQIKAAGVQPGDRVALMLPNVPAFAVWYFGALRTGAIAVSISTRSAASEVAYFLNDSGAAFFVTDEATQATISQSTDDSIPKNVVCVTTDDFGETCSAAGPTSPAAHDEIHDAHPNDAATILYTSGTTGFAKGATLSHMNVRSNVHAFNHLCNMRPDDNILLAVPLFHCFGQNALLNSAINVGATLVLQRRFDLNESKRLIADEKVTQLYGVPMMFQLFLDSCEPAELSGVHYCFSAAATLPVQVGEQWQQKFGLPIHEGYGLTETSPFASYNHRDRFVCGSIGTPIDCVEMKVVDTETGDDCPPGELGEIIIRGPNVMLGYWNREEETSAAIRDGWFHSGDIGRQEEDGFFYIVDRVKDMIAVGGLKVFPAEVERVLLNHATVKQVAVVGIPDGVFGEQVVAFVVGTDDDVSPADLESLSQHARTHLANYKVPRRFIPIAELPRNPSGKVLKRELREYDVRNSTTASSDGSTSVTAVERSSEVQREPLLLPLLNETHAAGRQRVATEFIQGLVQKIAQLDELPTEETRFLDAGLDSLAIVEISNQLQIEIGPENEIPATLVFDHPRLCDLASYLVDTLLPNVSAAVVDQSVHAESTAGEPDLRDEIESMTEEEALSELMKELE